MGTYLLTKLSSFKPCYKWNTFNTQVKTLLVHLVCNVLNLVINGIPSILDNYSKIASEVNGCFKPCYKWNTFNTQ